MIQLTRPNSKLKRLTCSLVATYQMITGAITNIQNYRTAPKIFFLPKESISKTKRNYGYSYEQNKKDNLIFFTSLNRLTSERVHRTSQRILQNTQLNSVWSHALESRSINNLPRQFTVVRFSLSEKLFFSSLSLSLVLPFSTSFDQFLEGERGKILKVAFVSRENFSRKKIYFLFSGVEKGKMEEPFFDLVEFLRRPTITETLVDILLCAVPIWLAVMIGLVIGWSWRPRWTGLVFLGLRSKFRFLWTAPPGFGARRLWLAFTALSAFSVCRTIWSNFRNKSKGSIPNSSDSVLLAGAGSAVSNNLAENGGDAVWWVQFGLLVSIFFWVVFIIVLNRIRVCCWWYSFAMCFSFLLWRECFSRSNSLTMY